MWDLIVSVPDHCLSFYFGGLFRLLPNLIGFYRPPHDKTNKMASAPSEDSDQPSHPPSLIRVFAVRSKVAKDPIFLHVDSEDSDQTGRMPRLI